MHVESVKSARISPLPGRHGWSHIDQRKSMRLLPHLEVTIISHHTVSLSRANSQQLRAKSFLQNSSPATAAPFRPAPVRTERQKSPKKKARAPGVPPVRQCGWTRRVEGG